VIELELAGTSRQETVAYRRGVRYVREVEAAPFAPATFDQGRIVAGGTYLVTVGDDPVGERIARTLFERTPCRVLLVGARSTPAIEALTDRSSGRVVFAAADVTNLDQMRAVLEAAPPGAIRGVFHAASHRDERPLLVKTQSSVDDVLAPRIQGTRVLDELFEGRPLDFIALCASLETAIEPMLRFDACAAAAFCDAQAMAHEGPRNGHAPAVVLSLELAAGETSDAASAFSDDEFAAALAGALGRDAPRCLALGPVVPSAVALERELGWRRRALSVPALGDDIAAPKSESLEQGLLATARKALRAERLEPSESLRGRGMSELDLAWALAHVRTSYGLEPTLTELCESDTVAEILGDVQARAARRQGTQTSTFKHLVAMHNGNPEGRTPFFLVAGMFGNILNLRHLGHLLGAERQSFGIQARGLYGEAQPHMTIHEMAEAYLEELRRLQPHGPYALGGFSGGGLTALEMAQRLRAEGEEIGLLVMLDTPLPVQAPLTARDRAMIQLISLQQKGPRYFTEWAENRVKWEISKVQKRFRKIDEEYSPEQYKSDAVGAAFQAAVSAYRVEHYPGRLTLFRPKLDKAYHVGPNRFLTRERSVVLEDNGWSEHVSHVDVIEVPGDHDSMVLEPGVRVLAANLKELLERVDRLRAAQPQATSPRPVESSQRVELGQ
jgi:thioesterase domain-containing protein